jgi:plastocyanin
MVAMTSLRRSLPVALLLVLFLQAQASAATIDVSVDDNVFSPANVILNEGDSVHWTHVGNSLHTVTGNHPFNLWDSGILNPGDTFDFVFTAGGTYGYHCDFHTSMKGNVRVRLRAFPRSGPVGTKFRITVATIDAPSPFVYDIQKADPGGGFLDWMTGVVLKSSTFDSTGQPTGTYRFRSRLRNSSTGFSSDWSPPVSVSVTP